jgi:hypothetical protein
MSRTEQTSDAIEIAVEWVPSEDLALSPGCIL